MEFIAFAKATRDFFVWLRWKKKWFMHSVAYLLRFSIARNLMHCSEFPSSFDPFVLGYRNTHLWPVNHFKHFLRRHQTTIFCTFCFFISFFVRSTASMFRDLCLLRTHSTCICHVRRFVTARVFAWFCIHFAIFVTSIVECHTNVFIAIGNSIL